MKELVINLLAKEVSLKKEELANLIEVPPKMELGDFAFPCFALAKELKKSPLQIAQDLTEKLRFDLSGGVSGVEQVGAYVNFFVDKKLLAKKVLKEVQGKKWGENVEGKGKTICIDLSAPNIAKPFGIGHLRSTIIGDSISRIAKENGYKTIKINYLGDWGTQFGKMILAFKRWGSEKKLKENAIAHLQELYVKINADEELFDEARLEFKKLEEGDKENLALWKKFRNLSLVGFDEVYDLLNVDFDVISGESEYNTKMEAVVKELESTGILVESEGAKIVDLKEDNKGAVLIQKSDGTSLYATRDLAAAIDRKKKYNFDKLIYEVGSEQTLHFQQIFRTLELMGKEWSKDCIHVAHGLYLDIDGKKFSTRKGKTVYMKDILDETIEKAKKNLVERDNKLSKEELIKRAKVIAIAAIKYGDLKTHRTSSVVFDIDRFLSFEGDTGPYLLYSYARASSIMRKAKVEKANTFIDLKDEEVALIKKIEMFPEIVKRAYEHLAPNLIANYSFELAQMFNEFYHACPVMGSEQAGFRLSLVDAFRKTLNKSLGLLGIETLEEM